MMMDSVHFIRGDKTGVSKTDYECHHCTMPKDLVFHLGYCAKCGARFLDLNTIEDDVRQLVEERGWIGIDGYFATLSRQLGIFASDMAEVRKTVQKEVFEPIFKSNEGRLKKVYFIDGSLYFEWKNFGKDE